MLWASQMVFSYLIFFDFWLPTNLFLSLPRNRSGLQKWCFLNWMTKKTSGCNGKPTEVCLTLSQVFFCTSDTVRECHEIGRGPPWCSKGEHVILSVSKACQETLISLQDLDEKRKVTLWQALRSQPSSAGLHSWYSCSLGFLMHHAVMLTFQGWLLERLGASAACTSSWPAWSSAPWTPRKTGEAAGQYEGGVFLWGRRVFRCTSIPYCIIYIMYMYKLKYDIKILEKLLRVPTYWFRIWQLSVCSALFVSSLEHLCSKILKSLGTDSQHTCPRWSVPESHHKNRLSARLVQKIWDCACSTSGGKQQKPVASGWIYCLGHAPKNASGSSKAFNSLPLRISKPSKTGRVNKSTSLNVYSDLESCEAGHVEDWEPLFSIALTTYGSAASC